MNLLLDEWITIQRRSGSVVKIAPIRLTANKNDPAVEILAPRADFSGALYQFLISLLQTAFTPRDAREWQRRWKTPSEAVLHEALSPIVDAFEFDTDGPAFMQDFDLHTQDFIEIASLLVDAPGDKTISINKDHFVHRDRVRQVCYACAATALFTRQINAPSGGSGHDVSLRGGGPLTTRLIYEEAYANLWHKLWINVRPKNNLMERLNFSDNPSPNGTVFPWLAQARTSGPESGCETTPETAHPLQVYWSMPWRIRLEFADGEEGMCDLCGEVAERLVRRYQTMNYRVNYSGAWIHPLSLYDYNPNEERPSSVVEGHQYGVGCHRWLGLTQGNEKKMPVTSITVKHFNPQYQPDNERQVQLLEKQFCETPVQSRYYPADDCRCSCRGEKRRERW